MGVVVSCTMPPPSHNAPLTPPSFSLSSILLSLDSFPFFWGGGGGGGRSGSYAGMQSMGMFVAQYNIATWLASAVVDRTAY